MRKKNKLFETALQSGPTREWLREKHAEEMSTNPLTKNALSIVPEELDEGSVDDGYAKIIELMEIDGMTEDFAYDLLELDISTIDELKVSTVDVLVRVNGIGKVTAEKFIADAKEFED